MFFNSGLSTEPCGIPAETTHSYQQCQIVTLWAWTVRVILLGGNDPSLFPNQLVWWRTNVSGTDDDDQSWHRHWETICNRIHSCSILLSYYTRVTSRRNRYQVNTTAASILIMLLAGRQVQAHLRWIPDQCLIPALNANFHNWVPVRIDNQENHLRQLHFLAEKEASSWEP